MDYAPALVASNKESVVSVVERQLREGIYGVHLFCGGLLVVLLDSPKDLPSPGLQDPAIAACDLREELPSPG